MRSGWRNVFRLAGNREAIGPARHYWEGVACWVGVLCLMLSLPTAARAQQVTPRLGPVAIHHWLTHFAMEDNPITSAVEGVNTTPLSALSAIANGNAALVARAGNDRAWMAIQGVQETTLPVAYCTSGWLNVYQAAEAQQTALGVNDPLAVHAYLLPTVKGCFGGITVIGNTILYNKPLQWLLDYGVGRTFSLQEYFGLSCVSGVCSGFFQADPVSVMAAFPVDAGGISGKSYGGWARVTRGWIDVELVTAGVHELPHLDLAGQKLLRVQGTSRVFLIESWPQGLVIRRLNNALENSQSTYDVDTGSGRAYVLTLGAVVTLEDTDVRLDSRTDAASWLTLGPAGSLGTTAPPVPATCGKSQPCE